MESIAASGIAHQPGGVTETGIVHLLRLRAQLRQIGDVKTDT